MHNLLDFLFILQNILSFSHGCPLNKISLFHVMSNVKNDSYHFKGALSSSLSSVSTSVNCSVSTYNRCLKWKNTVRIH